MTTIHLLPALKSALGNVPGLRSVYQQTRILGSILCHRYITNQPTDCDRAHVRQEWNFMAPAEQDRYGRVIRAIAEVRGPGDWGNVLEVGCSEGFFTVDLARRCRHVDAVDLSTVACERAAARCKDIENITIRQGNLLDIRPGSPYDIILAMCVWEYLHGRGQHSVAAAKVHSALRPGGLLILNATRLPYAYERSWWARWLVEGAMEYVDFLTRRGDLILRSRESTPDYMIAVFEKRAAPVSAFPSRVPG